MITIVKSALILLAVLLSPIWLSMYGVWVWIGSIMDRRGQRACAVMKGMLRDAA